MEVTAYAKMNFTFEVLGRRQDGFHEVKTILQTIDLADRLEMDLSESLSVECDYPELEGDANLVWRAASALAGYKGILPRANIRLQKYIPVGMGLGGGSSDAAAALLALNRLWELDLPIHELASVAAEVGSDVSFFLWGGTALAEGRGEQVSPLPPMPPLQVTLVFPDLVIPNKTPAMYSKLTPRSYSDGGVTRRMVQILTAGHLVRESVGSCLFNAFEDIALWEYPALDEMQRDVTAQGGPKLHLCGAGPALFALPSSEAEHQTVVETLQPRGAGVYLVKTVPPTTEI